MKPLGARKIWDDRKMGSLGRSRENQAVANDVANELESLAYEKEFDLEVAWGLDPHYDDDRYFDSYYGNGAYNWLFRRLSLRWYRSNVRVSKVPELDPGV